MLANAVNATAGVGIGTFLGILVVLFVMKRAGRDVQLLRNSVFMTAVTAGMVAWTIAALTQVILL